MSLAANGLWQVFSSANRIGRNPSFTPRWSDKPLEMFLDDEQSSVARLPQADRDWLAAMHAALLVPIFAGGSDPRPFARIEMYMPM